MIEKGIYIVGMGPGCADMMTLQTRNIIEESDIVVGYTVYVDLLKKDFPNKHYESTPMKQELERCRLCFDYACEGKSVALVCSGDAGTYGMASPVLQLQMENENYKDVDICVIPGITAANSGAAVLGAPLNHDYCVISLSDLLTPWEKIEKRLRCAIEGDFAIALYNPSSIKRKDHLKKACKIMLDAGVKEDRVAGYVENIGRENTKAYVCTLKELMNTQVNMFTTVFIGNSQSVSFTNKNKDLIITKRGYSS